MSKRDPDAILRDELRRRLLPPEPSDRLKDFVAALGSQPEPHTPPTRLRPRVAAFGSLAAALVIVAVVAGGLWVRANNPNATPSPSPVVSAPASPSPSPELATPSTSPIPNATSRILPAWPSRSSIGVRSYHRLASGFIWVTGAPETVSMFNQASNAFLTSADDGATWTQLPLPEGAGSVTFTDPSHAFAVASANAEVSGYRTTFLRSSDGGQTWTKSVVVDRSNFQLAGWNASRFDMLDAQHGWLVLADMTPTFALWRTTDGGATWSRLVQGRTSSPSMPVEVQFVSATEGWGWSDAGALLHTTDGGLHWAALPLAEPPNQTLWTSPVVSNGSSLLLHAFVLPPDSKSADQWATWTSADRGNSWAASPLRDLSTDAAAVSDADGYVTGFYLHRPDRTSSIWVPPSISLLTPDGSLTEFSTIGLANFGQGAGRYATLTTATAASATEAWAAIDVCADGYMGSGLGARSCPRLVATFDAGKTWQPVLWNPSTGPTPSPTQAIAPPCCAMDPIHEIQRSELPLMAWLDGNDAWAVVGTRIYWTADAGRTWDSGSELPATGTIQFLDREHGFLTATEEAEPGWQTTRATQVYRTGDGGKSWTSTAIPTTVKHANWTWAHFTDATHGVLARCDGLIAAQMESNCETFTTDDGGSHFTATGVQVLPGDVWWLSPTVGWGIEYAMKGDFQSGAPSVTTTSDGGRTWQTTKLGVPKGAQAGWSPALAMQLTAGGSGRLLLQFDSILARYQTSDGGSTWTLAWQGKEPTVLRGRARAVGDELFAQDGKYFWKSSDFGATWTRLGPEPVEVHDFVITSPTDGWLLRAPGYGKNPDALMKSTDGGMTWQVVLNAPSNVVNP